ncbi:hypothetical protein [Mucilaginibacter paludis]|uniref:Uncharacterized protein n=1 Tax=Mucilaginibacter paludis DSM 18603 TaxID=714943 RepID=H1YHC9_9SPHI|nr:hypothetical protein [Mucilaginibacter paludis]EHQ25463.1 hypothetical protein Mucpa_1301 [Mucilaginibacter paludis DSM 18603]
MKFKTYLSGLAIAFMISFLLDANAAVNNKPINSVSSKSVAPAVEGWYFRAISGYPAAITFEPVVLFKNGDYWEAGGETLETLNIATDKSKHPKAWGTWKKQGQKFVLTNSKGEANDYKLGEGNWFPAYAYTGAVKLKPAYEKVSGGDYGNGLSALSIKKITFLDATHFNEGLNAGMSTGNAAAWKKSATGGTYRISGHTIEFTYNNGTVVKTSFALGAKGGPIRPDNALIFIGGYAYTDTE